MSRTGRIARWLGAGLLVGWVGSLSVGCAQERAPIDRVQAGALEKSFFVGEDLRGTGDDPEFYMRNTVIDVPYGAGLDGLFTATYAQPVNRIKWEITEQNLVGRLTHERIENSDHKGARRTNDGQVVAMFAIQSHFDVRRGYNPTTGEENNIIEENTTDRPWYERTYFRVDWSKNLVTDGYAVDTASMLGMYGGIKWSPLSYYVQDPKHPDAPVFAPSGGYFDVTTKAYASPELVSTPWGAFPACYLFGQYPVTNCSGTEVTLRLAFRRVVDTDFEPTEWTGQKQDAFGWFTEDRFGYDRSYGVVDERWHRFAAKFNLFEKSHIAGTQCATDAWRDEAGNVLTYKVENGAFVTDGTTGLPIPDPNGKPFTRSVAGGVDVHRDTDDEGTEDECQFTNASGQVVSPGSRCDEFSRKCTIPVHDRTTKVTPWYYGPESPPDLFASTADSIRQWDAAVRHALQLAKKVSAERALLDGSRFETDEATIYADEKGEIVPRVFVLCHNPVEAGDHPACGEPGLKARVGDLRYSMVNLITTPQAPSPWGIMVDAVDPLTGEKIAGSANEWTHVLDTAAQSAADLLRWYNGEITDAQVMSGTYLKDWVESSKLGLVEQTPRTLTAADVKGRVASLAIPATAKPAKPVDFASVAKQPEAIRAATERLAQKYGPSLDSQFEARRKALLGSPLEAMLVSPNMVQAAGFDPATPVAGNDALMQRASPLRGMNPSLRRWLDQLRAKGQAEHGACFVEEPEPSGLVGVARRAQKIFPAIDPKDPDFRAKNVARLDQIRSWVKTQLHLGVISHELGHSMGLRHNFTGSWDALNYHKEYWQLRTRNGKEPSCRSTDGAAFGTTPHASGSECAGPRWVDPVTETEVNGEIWRWATSTVMDYPGDVSQDMNGLGAYDKAAMRFGYGGLVDVEADTTASRRQDYLDYLESTSPFYFTARHYSEFQDAYKILGTCGREQTPGDPLSTTCTGPSLDFVDFRDMKDQGDKHFAVDRKGRVRHPYMFSSDEFAAPSNVTGNRFDAGADAYEKMQFLVTAYENRYVFDNFRRSRVQFTTSTVVNRLGARYFDMITGVTKLLGLYTQIYAELFGPDLVKDLTANPGYMLPLTLASADGFGAFARLLTRPEPGEYGVVKDGASSFARPLETWERTGAEAIPVLFRVTAGSGEGRFINNDYDFDKGGYWWSDYQTRVGSIYEKRLAMDYMFEAYNRFVQVDRRDFIDGRWKNINYTTLYPEQMRRLMASIMQSDVQTTGPYVIVPQGATATPVDAKIQYAAWDRIEPISTPASGVHVDPVVGWEQQFPSLVSAFYFAPTTLTMDWYDVMRVYVKGGPDEVTTTKPTVSFSDPESGIEYVAIDYGTEVLNGVTVNRGVGARMIAFANKLKTEAYEGAGATLKIKDQVKATALRRFVGNLAAVRQVSTFFGDTTILHAGQ